MPQLKTEEGEMVHTVEAEAPAIAAQSAATIADVLDRAADLIEPEGAWCQHRLALKDAQGRLSRCAVGAVQQAAFTASGGKYGSDLQYDAERVLNRFLGRGAAGFVQVLGGVGGATTFNDALGRTQAEVVAALRAAAVIARNASIAAASYINGMNP